MTTDIKELKRLAKSAELGCLSHGNKRSFAELDAFHVAAHPSAVLDLIAHIEQLEGQLSAQTAVSMTAQELANRIRNGEKWKLAETEQPSLTDERAAFEEDFAGKGVVTAFLKHDPDRLDCYWYLETQNMWEGWQARALLAQRQDSNKERLDWLLDWYLRDGMRSEIDPIGHIRRTTKEIILAAIDRAIANGAPK